MILNYGLSLYLISLYIIDRRFPGKNHALLNWLNTRADDLELMVEQNIFHQFLDQLHNLSDLQLKIFHGRETSGFSELKKVKQDLAQLIDNTEILAIVDQFVANLEGNYLNYLSIKDRKEFLRKAADRFFQVSADSILVIEKENEKIRRFLIWAVIGITFLAVLLSLCGWLIVSRYFKSFVSSQQLAIEAIEAKDYDFKLPPLPDDEIGDLTRTLQHLAQSLKKSLLQLIENEERFRNILDALPDAVFQADKDMKIVWANKKACEMGRVVIGELCHTVFLNSKKQCEDCPGQKVFATGETAETHILSCLAEDGPSRALEITAVPTVDNLDKVDGFVEIIRDITEKVQVEKENAMLAEQFQQAQKMESVGRLAGGVAHDFNNILSVINGYAELCLLEAQGDNRLQEKMLVILKSGKKAARLTQQLLAFSRKQVINPELLSLNTEIAQVQEMLARLLGEDIEIDAHLEGSLWPVQADRSQIEQVIINIAVNCRDAMPRGGKLLLETANITLGETYIKSHFDIVPGDYVMLAISDSGHGMTPEIKAHIFEPFFTTKEKGKGTGLGLAMVYGVVKQNAGEIIVYSEPEQGSTFKIYLPRAEEETVVTEKPILIEDESGRDVGTETILLVEDDENVRRLCLDILMGLGYTVIEAENGEDAFQACDRFHGTIDLLLTDVVMPKMSGTELATMVIDLCPKIKVLYMSGYTENAIVNHGVLTEGVNFIHKPFTPSSLAKAVRKILG